ncbi:hypothetical protein A3D84_02330 [Candidatus Woesebacteria bacterium RIFCSPHIGHO2_02_FULL_42_20]|uniref:Methyltransferase FkbM domain-containing protein n=1 Tax=Candidatus Woesebacteria bacterium RIFCSPHIGHO2_12_FULL_41_24 TaxID=1802510 RepID=A0A1F8ASR5_9BACT|nr:MAG: hypothetical protein A2W15_00100 [Candidatus Woesebacteria bacterium RBG_16_41_13]OGM29426.1 MAG: hypothetical protein A2873_05035 [Candidatus Woesebacteria bacterium RIFCSPHIGHO2_01_FULL_42_80]OGM35005.1 MAG: hypothetical protein A3D84_02330 [Candidatus Woesebacteria bacterium RIFCSPHIGHO2_02_FULL_42_20]OGM54802.1 MAG: hypothetical protein A3E44_01435 [Candidatus Woesebacteria bacterium RIFCSPHIGHO2_12_FULL_41_24]OGM68320.1 MAG: hypothetical protein A2969_02945 [Candidatus Woesebacteri
MYLIKFIYALFENNILALKNIKPLKETVYIVYLYSLLKFKKLIVNDILGKKNGAFKIYGKMVYFPDFDLFEMMFIDVFIKQIEALETTNPNPFIIDCGANIGLSSFYLKLKYPNSQIICFEPAKIAFKYLKKNLSQFEGSRVINAAVVGKNVKSVFLETPSISSHADISSSVNPEIGKIRWQKIKVRREKTKAVKLSNYINSNEVVDFVKIDIEGEELAVLKDLVNSKKIKQIKEMFVEYHHHRKNSLVQILKILDNNGFKIIPSGDVRPPLPPFKNKFYIAYFWAYKD